MAAFSPSSLLLLFLLAPSLILGTGPGTPADTSLEYLLRKITQPPALPDPTFECAWRVYAAQYAVQIQPWLTPSQRTEVADALQLSSLCNTTLAHVLEQASAARAMQGGDGKGAPIELPPAFRTDVSSSSPPNPSLAMPPPTPSMTFTPPASFTAGPPAFTYYVATNGDDRNAGTSISAPKQTLQGALQALRSARKDASPAAIYLRQGTYHLQDTITLTAQDSFLTIAAYGSEAVNISGARVLAGLQWKPSHNPSIYTADLSAIQPTDLPAGIRALRVNGFRATLARYPNANPELDMFPKGYMVGRTAQTWLPPTFRGQVCNPDMQCGISVNVTVPVTDAWHGIYQNWTVGYGGACEIYDPPYSPWCSGFFYLWRQFPEMHTRHPSGLETPSLPHAPYARPEGAVVHAWRPGHWYTWMFEINNASFNNQSRGWRTEQGENNVYGLAPVPRKSNDVVQYLGNFSSSDECFAACRAIANCTTWTYHEPDFNPDYAFGCYSRRDGVYAPIAEEKVTSGFFYSGVLSSFTFGAGGTQGGEGFDSAQEWFIENVLEELDAENEFFYDAPTQQLYLYYNGTGVPPSVVAVPTLAVLFHFDGSQEAPLQNVTLANLTLIDTRPTFMDPRSNPSGGDWSLERIAAVLMEGTEDCVVYGCEFVRLDGNALLLSAYNRRAQVVQNRFSWLGQNAMASWGRTLYNDGTDGNQPRFTLIEGNFIHEIGHYQKQSSCFFQAESAQTTIRGNICFNIPRAGVNFNDGFGGANVMTENLLFNTCRESSDHGAFNSWDRLPYITDVGDGHTASTVPALNDVHHNFIVANYAADGGCLDNDDGSSYYSIHHNFCVYGGHKSDFDGHNKTSAFNLHAYANVYGSMCLKMGDQHIPPAAYPETYHHNVCILANANDHYVYIDSLNPSVGRCLDNTTAAGNYFRGGMVLAANSLYAPNGEVKVRCENREVDFAFFQQQLGLDAGSTLSGDMPSSSTIIAWARALLDGRV